LGRAVITKLALPPAFDRTLT